MLHPHLTRANIDDKDLHVHFYSDAIEDEARTAAEGRPVYRNVERIRIAGMRDGFGQIDNTFEIDTLVNSTHIRRFPGEYQAFKATLKEAADGTPLKMWAVMTPASIKELAAFGLFTVEQLAELSPRELRQNPWLQEHYEKAVSWLRSLTDTSEVLRLQAEIAELNKKVEHLTVENNDLIRQLVEGHKQPKAPKQPAK